MITKQSPAKVKNSLQQLEELFKPLLTKGIPLYLTVGLTKQDLDALYVIAYNLYAEGKYQEALKVFQTMVFYNHFDKRGWLGHAACSQMLRRYNDAILSYSYVSLIDIEDVVPIFHAIECYIALKKYSEARSALEAMLSLVEKKPQFAHLKNWGTKVKEALPNG